MRFVMITSLILWDSFTQREVKQALAQIFFFFLKFAHSPLTVPDSNSEILQW